MTWNGTTAWLLLWLLAWAVEDLRYREIPLWQILLVLITGILCQGLCRELWTWNIVGGILLGAGACGFSWATKDRFGMGDGLVILCVGVYQGFALALSISLSGLLVASVLSLGLMLFRGWGRQQSIPLIPCLGTGYLWMLWIGQ